MGETAYGSAPQLALLRHNDLVYLADHLLLLPHLYSPRLEGLAGGEVWYGDEALRLKACARGMLQQALAEQAGALQEAIRALEASLTVPHGRGSSSAGAREDIAARKSRDGVLLLLQRVGRLVWPTLAPGVALDFCARLLGPLFQVRLLQRCSGERGVGAGGNELLRCLARCHPLPTHVRTLSHPTRMHTLSHTTKAHVLHIDECLTLTLTPLSLFAPRAWWMMS